MILVYLRFFSQNFELKKRTKNFYEFIITEGFISIIIVDMSRTFN